jgi:hypothetical protein
MRKHHTVMLLNLDIYVIAVYSRKRKEVNEAEYYRIYSSG